jgi:hypothetical protein
MERVQGHVQRQVDPVVHATAHEHGIDGLVRLDRLGSALILSNLISVQARYKVNLFISGLIKRLTYLLVVPNSATV